MLCPYANPPVAIMRVVAVGGENGLSLDKSLLAALDHRAKLLNL